MPRAAPYVLRWSAAQQRYALRESSTQRLIDLDVGSPAWVAWVSHVSSFAFQGSMGFFTARQEQRERGGGYWYAYMRTGSKVTKRYLGSSADLTLPRLEEAAHLLGAHLVSRAPLATAQQAMLVVTKIYQPRLRSPCVHRTQLMERLQQGAEGACTLLSAPAGFGKTTLLSDWLTSSGMPVAWVSLEPADNDLGRFLTYLVAALQLLDPAVGEAALALLHSSPQAGTEALMTLLINDVTRRQGPRVALVMDDYHVIEAPPIHQALLFLLEHLPPRLHLVISSRADPPFPLTRLRARNQLSELRASDLRFEASEADAFLRTVMHLELTPEEVALLRDRTEGWIAGMQFAALSLRGSSDAPAFLAAFSGSHRFVLDYLSEEVFMQQSEEVQAFLLHTCMLERLCGSLAQAVTGEPHAQRMLEALEHANLFLVALDDSRQWYRYHQLFAEVLRSRLRQTQPALLPELHRRASKWYEQQALLDEAIEHALAASDYEGAAQLIERAFLPVMRSRGAFRTILRWMDGLPNAWIEAHPQFAVLYAWVLLVNQARPWPEIEAWMQQIAEPFLQDQGLSPVLEGELAALRTMAAEFAEDHPRTIALSSQTLALLPAGHWTRGTLLLSRGVALLSLQRLPEAVATFEQAVARIETEDAQQLLLVAKSMLANALVALGRLREARRLYEEVLRKAPEQHTPLRGLLLAHGGLGNLLREWNDFPAALTHLQAGLDMERYVGGLLPTALAIYLPLARIYVAQKRREEALAALDDLGALAHRASSPQPSWLIAAWKARCSLMLGERDAAERWAEESGLSLMALPANHDALLPHEMSYLTLVRLALVQGRAEEVLPLLDLLESSTLRQQKTTSYLEVLLLHALALEAVGHQEQALAYVQQALTLAEPEGYIRLFVDEGQPLARLLLRARGTSPNQQAYLQQLLAAFPASGAKAGQGEGPRERSRAQPLVDPLSERELEVLQLLAAGVANADIAARLVIEVSTVKRHVSNILAKLSASNRTQAVARARELHLLPTP